MAGHLLWRDASGPDYRRFIEKRNAATGAFLSIDPSIDATPATDSAAAIDADPHTHKVPGAGSVREHSGAAGAVALAGVPFAIKDNIALAERPLTCGSKLLESFVSPYTATAVQRLMDAGARPVGKTNLDEFGMGSSTENSALGATHNPWNLDHVPGGSSGGSATAVAAGMVPFALGSDTGGSVRQPAAFCGVYGLKPTYGSVSRHGLVAYASSLDVIGVLATGTNLVRSVFTTIRGIDSFDQSSVRLPENHPTKDDPRRKAATIAVIDPPADLSSAVADSYRAAVSALQNLGIKTVTVELQGLDYAVAAYYTIATAEAAANLARFTGIRYGARPAFAENPEELVRAARTEGFGREVKLRILLGTYVLRSGFQDRYYIRALRIQNLLRAQLSEIFAGANALLLPTYPSQAFARGGALTPMQQKLGDKYTTIANLSGFPALAFPVGTTDGLPLGHQLMGPAFSELELLSIADELAEVFPAESPADFPPVYKMPEEAE